MPGKPWHWAEIEWAHWCSRKHRSAIFIAQTLGRPVGAVRVKLAKLGIPTFQQNYGGGAPLGNCNGAASWFRRGNYPARWRRAA